MNVAILTGNLCRDIDLRKTGDDKTIGRTGIAVRRDRKDKDGEYPTDFFDVTLFGNQADFAAKYLRKGDKVCVRGSVQIRDYTNKDNIKCRAIEIVADGIESLEKKDDSEAKTEASADEPKGENLEDLDLPDDDLPF